MRRSISQHKLFASLISALLLLLGGFFLYHVYFAHGATITWTGGGGDGKWSTCANWSGSVCPGSSDIASFDNTNTSNATIDSAFAGSVAGVTIASGYTGTITFQRDLTIGGSQYSQADGTVVMGTSSMSVSSAFTQSGGTFSAGVGTTTIKSFTVSGTAVFNASTTRIFYVGFNTLATFTYPGTFPGTVKVKQANYFNYKTTFASGTKITNLDTTGNAGYVTVNSGATIIATSSPVNASVFSLSGSLYASSTMTVTNLTLNTGSVFSYGTTTLNTCSLIVNGGTYDFTGKTVAITTNCTGTFTYPGSFPGHVLLQQPSVYVTYGVTFTSGTSVNNLEATSNNGYITINSGAAIYATSTLTAGKVTVSGSLYASSTMTLGGSLTVNSGSTFSYDPSVINCQGIIVNGGTYNFTGKQVNIILNSGATFTYPGTYPGLVYIQQSNYFTYKTTITSGTTINQLDTSSNNGYIVINSGATVIATSSVHAGNLVDSGSLYLQGVNSNISSFTISSGGTLGLYGNEAFSSTPILSSGSTVVYDGPSSYTSLTDIGSYSNLEFASGTYTLSTSTFTVSGDFTNSGATLTQTGGGLTLNGANQTITGTSTFYNFTKTLATTSTSTLLFGANQTQTIAGAFDLEGYATGSPLYLRSTATGTQYKLDPQQAFPTLKHLDIRDADNIDSLTLYCATDCTDSTNNTNIVFGPNPNGTYLYWTGGGGDNNWSTCTNWLYSTCPTTASDVRFNATSTKNSTVDSAAPSSVNSLTIDSGYIGTITGTNLSSVGSYTQAGGTFVATSSSLTLSGDFNQTGGTFTGNGGTVYASTTATLSTSANSNFSSLTIGAPYDANLIGHWKLDESTAGTFTDSVGGYTGTGSGTGGTNNTPQPSTDVPSQVHFSDSHSLNFDGTDDKVVTTGGVPTLTNPFTIAAWVKADQTTGTYPAAFGIYNSTTQRVAVGFTSGVFKIISSGETSGSGNAVTTGQWYHLTMVYDGTSFSLYEDGAFDYSVTPSGSNWQASTKVTLGQDGGADSYFKGNVDDVRIYSRALSSGEIATLAAGRPSALSHTETVSLAGSGLTATADLSIDASSTLEASTASCSGTTCDINVAGNWTNYGTFTSHSNTVTLNGTNQFIVGTTTFGNLTKTVTATDTLTMPASSTLTITGTLTLRGDTTHKLILQSSVSGSPWYIDPQSTRDVYYVKPSDGYNTNASALICYNSTDNGNNVNFSFQTYTPPVTPPIIYKVLRGAVNLLGGVHL